MQKPITEFYRMNGRGDGWQYLCKPCSNDNTEDWYRANPGTRVARTTRWRKENPEAFRAQRRAHYAANKEYFREAARKAKEADPEGYLRIQLRSRLKVDYGMTLEEYDGLLARQDGLCAICREPMARPEVDHDHGDGHVRGILCGPCNRGLGYFRDDPKRLRAAIGYLSLAGPHTGHRDRSQAPGIRSPSG